jgi:hypothetical protein
MFLEIPADFWREKRFENSSFPYRTFSISIIIQGCQILLRTTYQNGEKIYQMTTKYPNGHKTYEMVLNIPNGNKLYQHFLFQCPPECTQIGIFGMEICTIWQPCHQEKKVCFFLQPPFFANVRCDQVFVLQDCQMIIFKPKNFGTF